MTDDEAATGASGSAPSERPGEGATGDASGKLRAFLRPWPWLLPGVAVLGALASLAEGLGIALMIPFLGSLTSAAAGDASAAGTGVGGVVARAMNHYAALFPEGTRLVAVAATIVLMIVLSCAMNFAYLRVLSRAATRTSHSLRVRLFERFVIGDAAFVEQGSQGRGIQAVDGSAHRAGQAVISLCLIVVNAVTIAVVLGVLALISWRMTLVVLVGVASAGLAVRTFVARGLRVSRSFERRASHLSETVVQTLGSVRTVRIFGQEARELADFTVASDAVQGDQLKLEVMRRATDPLIDAVAAPLIVAGLVAASLANVGMAVLLPFLLLVFRLQRHVRELDVSRVWLAADAGAVLEVAALLDAPPPRVPPGRLPFEGLREDIAFEAVSFAYPGGSATAPGLHDVTFSIRRGETVGIVGGSGAGKSTLIDLLCGIHAPSTGTIRIDGVALARLDPLAWRRRLGFAGQDADLRAGSVFENIAYGDPQATPEAVHEAAARAGVADFIAGLPRGYDTAVGLRGMQLSGGERQRIALARALLRHPDVLILDEATNALDNPAEAAILDTLDRLAGTLTTIVVAHRLSSLRHVDRVLVLANGRLVEDGHPARLLEADGTFPESGQRDAERTRISS